MTRIAASPDGEHVAAGYADGTIRIFDSRSMRVVLNGHKRAVSALAYDSTGTLLVSGSRDTDVIVWDIAAERGVCRFRGHRDEVTDVVFLPHNSIGAATNAGVLLASSSKDTLIKVWDVGAAACIQTIVGSRVEMWSLCVTPDGKRLLAGGADNQLRVWSIRSGGRADDAAASNGEGAGVEANAADIDASALQRDVLSPLGSIVRQSSDRVTALRSSSDGAYIAVGGTGKVVEVYKLRTPDEARRRVTRRLKRHREKLAKKRARVEAATATTVAASSDEDDENDGEGGLQLLGATLADVDTALAALALPSSGASGRAAHSRYVIASDEWEIVAIASSTARVTSIALLPPVASVTRHVTGTPPQLGQLLVATQHNTVDVFTVPLNVHGASIEGGDTVTTAAGVKVPSAVLARSIAQAGHRSDVRAVAVSDDGTLLLSTSAGCAKVWNAKTGSCIRTLDFSTLPAADGVSTPSAASAVGLCVGFLPGDRHALVGTKDGRLLLFNLASGDLLEEHVAAHEGPVWSLAVRPDGRGVATGGGTEVKFWDFQIKSQSMADGAAPKRRAGSGGESAPSVAQAGGVTEPTLVHSRTLKLTDEVLCVTFSRAIEAEKLLIAVALVDATVKVRLTDDLSLSISDVIPARVETLVVPRRSHAMPRRVRIPAGIF